MVHCPILLRRKKDQGISITELLIVVAVIAILMVVLLSAFKPSTQLAKARDARRKSDLQKLKNPLEDYYNDKQCYPSALLTLVPDYIGQVPIDPVTKLSYQIQTSGCDKYRIYAQLENAADPVIAEVGCQEGCGSSCPATGNYGICSTNTSLQSCQPTPGPSVAPCVKRYACSGGVCSDVASEQCIPEYCNPNCECQCADNTDHPECPGNGTKSGCVHP